jgi:Site-specific recombinase XerD
VIDEMFDRFEREYLDVHSISADRRIAQRKVLGMLQEQMGRPVSDIASEDLATYLGSRIKRGLHPNTVLKEMTMIRSFCTWAHGAGLIDDGRMMRLKAIAPPRGSGLYKPKPYKPIEIRTLYEELEAKYPLLPLRGKGSYKLGRYYQGRSRFDRIWRHARRLQYEAMISLALEEGLRRIEIFRSNIAEIHPDNIAVVVRGAKGRPGQDRTREVPFTAHSRQRLEDWLDFRETLGPPHERPWLRLDPRSEGPLDPLNEIQMKEFFTHFDGPWKWHRLRHTFATERLRAGMPIEKLRVMLGHANIEHTLIYSEIVSSDVQADAERTEAAFAERLGLVA